MERFIIFTLHLTLDIRVIKSKKVRLVRQVACRAEMRNVYTILFGKTERRGPLARPRRTSEDNIKKVTECNGMDWINLAQYRI